MTDITTATDPFAHFLSAQSGATSGYVTALAELESGHKSGHWIWYVFPQLAGLGRSGMSQKFAISGDIEARQYIQHPVLGPRLLLALQVVHQQLAPAAHSLRTSALTMRTWLTNPLSGSVHEPISSFPATSIRCEKLIGASVEPR